MKKLLLASAAALALCAAPAQAHATGTGFLGQTLYETCLSRLPTQRLVCLAYIAGWADVMAAAFTVAGRQQCMPEGTTYLEMMDVVADHLQRNPAARRNSAADIVADALDRAYACQAYR